MAYASLLYSVFLLIEGCGLWLEASWAGYMAVISTSVFLPVGILRRAEQISVVHTCPTRPLLSNVAIVGYLVGTAAGATVVTCDKTGSLVPDLMRKAPVTNPGRYPGCRPARREVQRNQTGRRRHD
ncbi:MAG: DUF2127 domain-containing protein [Nitrospira sp.]|nr:DUF2127 domain-containing protein [Nitrospira sp.]